MSVLKAKIPLEAVEEKNFMKVMKLLPVKVRKLNGIGYRSWSDRMVLGPDKFFMMVELKRKKVGKLSEGQKELFAELALLGHHVLVSDDGIKAGEAVRQALIEHGVKL